MQQDRNQDHKFVAVRRESLAIRCDGRIRHRKISLLSMKPPLIDIVRQSDALLVHLAGIQRDHGAGRRLFGVPGDNAGGAASSQRHEMFDNIFRNFFEFGAGQNQAIDTGHRFKRRDLASKTIGHVVKRFRQQLEFVISSYTHAG